MLKNLATCTPREFFAQTNKIRKLAKDWVSETGILDFNNLKDLAEIKGKSEAEASEIVKNKIIDKISDLLDKLFEKDADKTVCLLCYCCFVDPKESEKHQMWEFLESISQMISNEAVIGFFTSLTGLLPNNISDILKK